MPNWALPSTLWKIARRFKEAWEWWAICTVLGLVPVVHVMFGFLEGQPWSVILLYMMAAVAYGILLIVEGRPLIKAGIDKAKRKRRSVIIQWGQDNAFVHSFTTANEGYRLFRIAIRNTGVETIGRVEIELQHIEPQTNPAFPVPVPLHLMHDNPPLSTSFSRQFSLDPGHRRFVDVVQRADIPGTKPFEVCHIVSGVERDLPIRTYKLKLTAFGDGFVAVSKWFELGVRTVQDPRVGAAWEESYFHEILDELGSG